MATNAPAPKDPRFRPYRAAAYALYLAVVSAFCAFVIYGVVKSVLAMTPHRPSAVSHTLDRAECARRVAERWEALDRERQAWSQSPKALQVDERWISFRVSWLEELRRDEALCEGDSPSRHELRQAFLTLEHVGDLYTTSAVQYAGEIGPSVDHLRRLLQTLGQPAR